MSHEEIAREACLIHLERKTRFEPEDLKVSLDQGDTAHFTIDATAVVRYSVSAKTFPGRTAAGVHDSAVHNRAQRDATIAEKARVATSRVGLIQRARPQFDELHPGNLPRSISLETIPGQIIYAFACSDCGGGGSVGCTTCGSSGSVVHAACNGTGYVTRTVSKSYTVNGRSQYRNETHREACVCQNGRQTCVRCSGAGRLRCDPCGATGQQSEVSTVSLIVQIDLRIASFDTSMADLESLVRTRMRVDEVAREALRHSYRWADRGQLQANGRFEMSADASRLAFRFDDTVVKPVVFGSSPRILELDGLAKRLVAEDLETLGHLVASGGKTKSRRRALAEFIESEVHQDMIDAAIRGKKPREIANALSGSLDRKYISDALTTIANASRLELRRATGYVWALSMLFAGLAVGIVFFLGMLSVWKTLAYVTAGTLISAIATGSAWTLGPQIGKRNLTKIGGRRLQRLCETSQREKARLPSSFGAWMASAGALVVGVPLGALIAAYLS